MGATSSETMIGAGGVTGGARLGRYLAGVLAVLFGIATLVEGGHVLFGGAEAKAEAGNVVPFVLTFNFGAGFLYFATGLSTLLGKPWAVWLARLLAVATVLVFAAFGIYVMGGGASENRTAAAMTIRSVFWIAQALALPVLLRRGGGKS